MILIIVGVLVFVVVAAAWSCLPDEFDESDEFYLLDDFDEFDEF